MITECWYLSGQQHQSQPPSNDERVHGAISTVYTKTLKVDLLVLSGRNLPLTQKVFVRNFCQFEKLRLFRSNMEMLQIWWILL